MVKAMAIVRHHCSPARQQQLDPIVTEFAKHGPVLKAADREGGELAFNRIGFELLEAYRTLVKCHEIEVALKATLSRKPLRAALEDLEAKPAPRKPPTATRTAASKQRAAKLLSWHKAVALAREALGLKGSHVIKKNTALSGTH